MPGNSSSGGGPSLIEAVKTAAEDMVDLIGAQIHLARAEVVKDVGLVARRSIRLAIFVPVLLGGYGFAMAALAWVISRRLGTGGGLAVVAVGQLLVGGIGLVITGRRTRSIHLLERSSSEASATVRRAVTAISTGVSTIAPGKVLGPDSATAKTPTAVPPKATPHVE